MLDSTIEILLICNDRLHIDNKLQLQCRDANKSQTTTNKTQIKKKYLPHQQRQILYFNLLKNV